MALQINSMSDVIFCEVHTAAHTALMGSIENVSTLHLHWHQNVDTHPFSVCSLIP